MYVLCVMYGICAILLCNCCLDGIPGDVLFVAIVAVEVFMAQLLSPRQISLSGTIKYIVLYCIVLYCIVLYSKTKNHIRKHVWFLDCSRRHNSHHR